MCHLCSHYYASWHLTHVNTWTGHTHNSASLPPFLFCSWCCPVLLLSLVNRAHYVMLNNVRWSNTSVEERSTEVQCDYLEVITKPFKRYQHRAVCLKRKSILTSELICTNFCFVEVLIFPEDKDFNFPLTFPPALPETCGSNLFFNSFGRTLMHHFEKEKNK